MDNQIITSKEQAANLVYTFLANTPKRSRQTYLYSLNKVARHLGYTDAYSFDWSKLRNSHTTIIRAWLLETSKPSTAQRAMVVIKGVLTKAYDLELMDGNDYLHAIRPCKVRMNEKPSAAAGRMLSKDETLALLEACKRGAPKRAIRDTAILTLMIYTGIRRAEVTTLTLADYEPTFFPDAGRLLVHGKGDKDRTIPIKFPREALGAWLEVRGNAPGPLFYSILKSDEPYPRKMGTVAVWRTLKDRGEMARLKPFTPHDLRRTFCSDGLARKIDLSTMADLMGHADTKTTKGYDRRGEQRKVDAVE
jgi:integrase/recombinase XerD